MQSILEQFACGKINAEEYYFDEDSEYSRAMQKLSDLELKLTSTM